MDLLIVRHAIAADPADYPDDAARPLTAEGKKKKRQAAKRLRRLVPAIGVGAAPPPEPKPLQGVRHRSDGWRRGRPTPPALGAPTDSTSR